MDAIPTFETDRLILKRIELTNAPSYQKYFVDYEVIKYLSNLVPWPYPESGIEPFLKNFILPQLGINRWFWGIFLKNEPHELVGVVDLWREEKPENRGFWLAKKFWGQGIMTEAVVPINDYAFEHLGFERLIFSNAVGNTASRRVKEKTGAVLIGTRPAKFVSPEFTEAENWELTKENWKKFRMASTAG